MADTGPHANPDGLGADLLDLVHRVRTDSGRLTEAWADRSIDALGPGSFVEASGLVATLAVIDTLTDALGAPRRRLPDPSTALATREEPDGLTIRHCWVPTVHPDQASGPAASLYDGGSLATVVEALTMSPHATELFWRLVSVMYIKPGTPESVADTEGGLTLSDVELLAARVSALNECFY